MVSPRVFINLTAYQHNKQLLHVDRSGRKQTFKDSSEELEGKQDGAAGTKRAKGKTAKRLGSVWRHAAGEHLEQVRRTLAAEIVEHEESVIGTYYQFNNTSMRIASSYSPKREPTLKQGLPTKVTLQVYLLSDSPVLPKRCHGKYIFRYNSPHRKLRSHF